ncbi:hypothetical protein TWF730_007137 [Orbilia blumenaviensis]|uniref:Uncharacterized protein n=1 Tax=Orbilia blumenaviensis TaxID=1796055 RepID=A0AAV9VHT3_9PEZI
MKPWKLYKAMDFGSTSKPEKSSKARGTDVKEAYINASGLPSQTSFYSTIISSLSTPRSLLFTAFFCERAFNPTFFFLNITFI